MPPRSTVRLREQDIQRQILDFLRFKGIYCWKNSTVGIFNPKTGGYIPSHAKGVSDILGILPGGRFLAIEVKRPGGRPSEHQVQFLQEINGRRGLAFIAYSVEDVERQLNEEVNHSTH